MLLDSHNRIVKGYRFLVFIGPDPISFASVSGLEESINKEFIGEGGSNGMGRLLVTPTTEQNTLHCERGVQRYNPMLSRMKPGVSIPAGITIIVLNNRDIPVHEYHVSDAVVLKWDVSEFDATSERVLIESFDVAYTKLDRTNLQTY